MGGTGLGIALAVGAALVAVWLDHRFDARRPGPPLRRMGHAFAAYGFLRLASVATVHLGTAGTSLAQKVAVLFLFFVPALAYAFLTGFWVLRTLADAARLARR